MRNPQSIQPITVLASHARRLLTEYAVVKSLEAVMRVVLWVVLGLIAFFGFMNWPVLNAPVPLWLGVTTITAPLGTLMLVLFGIVVLLMLIEQSIALAETRRYGRDLNAQRKLAD